MIKFKKIEGDIRKHFPQVKELFRNDKEVVLAYLFGSYGRDNVGPLSDVDVAVLLHPMVSKNKFFDEQLRLQVGVCRILHTDEVDLVILNEAPITFRFSVISSGRAIYCADETIRIGFEAGVMLDYLDTSKLRDEYFYHLKKRIKEGTYGVGLEQHRAAFEQTARLFKRS